MIKFVKIVPVCHFILLLSWIWFGSIECNESFTVPWGFEESQTNPTYIPPASKSSSTSNYENFYNFKLIKEDLLLTKEAYPGHELYKNKNITIKLGIISNKNFALDNTYLFDMINEPFFIDIDSFIIDQGPESKKLEYKLIDSSHPAEENFDLVDKKEKYIITLSPRKDRINFTIKRLNKSEMIYLSYNISTNVSGKYSFQPFRLYTSDFLEGKKILQSNPLFLDIIDRNPIINSIKIKPNPAKTDEEIEFYANLSDPDDYDLDRIELLSSIDGNLDDLYSLNLSNTQSCIYDKKISGLSEGNHLITLRIFDKDMQIAEETITLNVNKYRLWKIPNSYFWTVILGCVLVLIEILIKNNYKKILEHLKKIFLEDK